MISARRPTSVVVTGASGFIGGHLVRRLVEEGFEVRCPVRGTADGLAEAGALVERVELCDRRSLARLLDGADWVFHSAFDWHDPEWNRQSMRILLDEVSAARCARLVHVSSFSVYDYPVAGELTEETIWTPATGGYGAIKRDLELLALDAARVGTPVTIVQPTVVYGPQDRAFTLDLARRLRNGRVILPGAGEGVCNAIFVDDVVSALLRAARASLLPGARFLVSGEAVTWAAFHQAVKSAIGASGLAFWPVERIEREHALWRRAVRLMRSPTRLARPLARKPLAGRVWHAARRALPSGLGSYLDDQLFGPPSSRRGALHLPGLSELEYLDSRCVVTAARAREQLGFRPRVRLTEGMAQTAPFLQTELGRS